jgi:hypothetical protein
MFTFTSITQEHHNRTFLFVTTNMPSYNIHDEAARIFKEELIADPTLELPQSIKEAAQKVQFNGGDGRPFVPTPFKMTESSAVLNGLVSAAASAVASDRYGIAYQDIEVNTDIATLFLESVSLPTIDDKPFNADPQMKQELAAMDLHDQASPIRRYATNIYKTKDGRWYMLHGSMNATPTMKMLRVEHQDVTREEAIKIYSDKVAKWDSAEIEKVANEKHRQAGSVCNTPEEFFASEHVSCIELSGGIAPSQPY